MEEQIHFSRKGLGLSEDPELLGYAAYLWSIVQLSRTVADIMAIDEQTDNDF
jgi:hypothetical protein